jgi:hypothetical protein
MTPRTTPRFVTLPPFSYTEVDKLLYKLSPEPGETDQTRAETENGERFGDGERQSHC